MKPHLRIIPVIYSLLLLMVAYPSYSGTFEAQTVQEVQLGKSPYKEISGMFSGSVEREGGTDASYSVPVTLLVPQKKCNNTAIVDVVNSVLYEFPATAELGHNTIEFGRLVLGDSFLAGRNTRRGFTYLSVIWDKTVVDDIGIGVIERASDGYQILADVSDYLRSLEVVDESAEHPCHIQNVIGFGWSQTGKLLADILTTGINDRESGPIFNGIFLGVAGGVCRAIVNEPFPWAYSDCEEPSENHVPTVAYNTQSETELSYGDGALRTPSQHLSVYDYAGISHIDAQFLPFGIVFADLAEALGITFEQNPISVNPSARAAFWNLYLQVKYSIPPAKSLLLHAEPIDGVVVEFLDRRTDATLPTWSGGQAYSTDSNNDGIADGGVRMPHIPWLGYHGKMMGAPLGLYGGIDYRFAGGAGIYFANGGTFQPYGAEELSDLYPNHKTYVKRVRAAVFWLVWHRYLLWEDGQVMIKEAEQSDIGK